MCVCVCVRVHGAIIYTRGYVSVYITLRCYTCGNVCVCVCPWCSDLHTWVCPCVHNIALLHTYGSVCLCLWLMYQLMMVLIKVADISNELRPMDVANLWLECLLEEYFQQVLYIQHGSMHVIDLRVYVCALLHA